MIKLIVLDLDGTLLSSEKKINPVDREAVKEALDAGISVTVFTGRSKHSASRYVKELGIGVPVVFQNGALIVDFSSGKILRMVKLSGEIAKKVVLEARKMDIFYIIYTEFSTIKDMMVDRSYKGPYEYYMEQNIWRMYFVKDVINHIREDVAEIALIGKKDSIEEAVSWIDEREASVIKSTEIGGESFWEIFGPGCSKAIALEFLLEHFGVSKDEVMFIGDGYNDVEVLKTVGYPVVMGNAPEDVKKYAKYITSDNDSGGVAEAIRKIALKKSE